MIYRLSNIKAPLDFSPDDLRKLSAAVLRIPESKIQSAKLAKQSVDARKKYDVCFVLSIDLQFAAGMPEPKHPNLNPITEKVFSFAHCDPLPRRPIVVGFGPAGMLAALALAEAGLRPIVLERGADVDQRAKDVSRFWSGGALNPDSNVQFGEGGAGAFSDGKLTTGIKDKRCAHVLQVFHEHGAPEEILHLAKPHIGTDNLPRMVKSIRERIIQLGGEVRFGHRLDQVVIADGRMAGAIVLHGEQRIELQTDDLILAVGHSARDTLSMLHALGVPMRKKPFSIGVRIEHSQKEINRSQYGAFADHPNLGAAEYKLSERLKNGRGVYTFCMCPGGQVVAAASEPGHLVVNGMSRFARDGENANSALLVSVEPSDFPEDSPLAGFRFQEHWEQQAFQLGGSNHHAPAQLVGDFLRGRPSEGAAGILPSYRPGVHWCDLRECLPEFAAQSLHEALGLFDRKLHGFANPNAVLTGIETRSSSPVTIPRDERYMSLDGLYPCGEGAGYAGGIMSAAVDGMRCAEAVIARHQAQ